MCEQAARARHQKQKQRQHQTGKNHRQADFELRPLELLLARQMISLDCPESCDRAEQLQPPSAPPSMITKPGSRSNYLAEASAAAPTPAGKTQLRTSKLHSIQTGSPPPSPAPSQARWPRHSSPTPTLPRYPPRSPERRRFSPPLRASPSETASPLQSPAAPAQSRSPSDDSRISTPPASQASAEEKTRPRPGRLPPASEV